MTTRILTLNEWHELAWDTFEQLRPVGSDPDTHLVEATLLSFSAAVGMHSRFRSTPLGTEAVMAALTPQLAAALQALDAGVQLDQLEALCDSGAYRPVEDELARIYRPLMAGGASHEEAESTARAVLAG